MPACGAADVSVVAGASPARQLPVLALTPTANAGGAALAPSDAHVEARSTHRSPNLPRSARRRPKRMWKPEVRDPKL